MPKNSKQFDFVCVGSATQDVFVQTNNAKILTLDTVREQSKMLCFEHGGKIDVEHIEYTTGGGATNSAVALARLGAKPVFLGKIGRDEAGEKIVRELAECGVDISYYLTSQNEATGYSVILTSFDGERTVLTHRGASTQLSEDEIDWSFLEKTAWVYVCSLAGPSAKLFEPLFERASKAGVRISFNPGGTQLRLGLKSLKPVLAKTEILILNKEEAAELTGGRAVRDVVVESRCTLCGKCIESCVKKVLSHDFHTLRASGVDKCIRCGKCIKACDKQALVMEPAAFNLGEIFDKLCCVGPKIVVITDGANGSQASDGKRVWYLPAVEAKVVSTLGAGDAFGSSFTYEYSKSEDIGRSLALGSYNSASVIQQVGAKNGQLTKAEAEKQMKQFDPSALRIAEISELLEAAKK